MSKIKYPLRVAIYIGAGFLISFIFYFTRTNPFSLFPTGEKLPYNASAFTYDDREQGGNSTSEFVDKRDALNLKFKLGGKYIYPYAGVSFPLESSSYLKLTAFNTLSLSLNVAEKSKILVIFSQHKKLAGSGLDIVQQCEYLLECSPDKTEYTIPFSSFQIPLWWIKSKQKAESGPIDWSVINSLSIQNDPALPNGAEQNISVSAIQFMKVYSWPLYAVTAFLLSIIILEYVVHKKVKRVNIRFVPVSEEELASDDPWDVLANYIAKCYREDLSLESIFKEVGIAKHKISSLIRENTSLNFRQYINLIRIQEAERLFNNTSLSITEIGYEVGYTSATQFNRVFREIKGIAPSEYKREPAH